LLQNESTPAPTFTPLSRGVHYNRLYPYVTALIRG
jgi:hypothetical protein